MLGIGLLAAIAKAANMMTFNLLGVAAVLAATTVAWLEAKDHSMLAAARAG